MHLEVSHKLTSRSGTDEIGYLPNATLCKIIHLGFFLTKKLNANNEFLIFAVKKPHIQLALPIKGVQEFQNK